MLRHHVQKSAQDAKRYYSLADYLPEGEELRAALGGRAAVLLGVENSNAKEHFERLCDNLHPLTGEHLTARTRDDRIVGIDLTFDGPKGYSILEALTGDPRLRQALDLAAEETMREMEQAATARVRKGGADHNRATRNLVWYRAPHDTDRPVDGIPDMQPHNHFFVLNATWDAQERKWKASNLFEILRDMPYYEAAFHNRLGMRLEALGYGVRRTHCGRYFEIEGVPQSAIEKFSRRTAQIKEAQAEKEAELGRPLTPEEKGQLGSKVREHKAKNLSLDTLRRTWVSWLTEGETETLRAVYVRAQEREARGWQPERVSAREALAWAAEHVFERKSSAPATELLAEALRYGVGGFGVGEAWAQLERDGRYTAKVDDRLFVASLAVRTEERNLTALAADGRATQAPINPAWEIQDTSLNTGQRAAVHHLLSSKDFVSMVIGAAGVGKTRLLKEAEQGANAAGLRVFAFAPSAAASRITMREDGSFPEADTVATLLTNKQLQARARGQVWIIDEGALLGTKETAQVFSLAKELGARLWIVGDDKQHRSVSRGAPFALLQTRAGITPAVVTENMRQQDLNYRDLVNVARDDPEQAWTRLRDMGSVVEVPTAERYWQLARDYLDAAKPCKKKGQWKEPSVLVVAPTHAEGARVTAAIRAGLRQQGKLGEEREVLRLTNLHLTEAQRGDRQSFEPGDVIQFTQHSRGFKRGQRVTVTEDRTAPTEHAKRFQAYRPGTLKIATGDRLRITQNGYSLDGKRLDNGMIVTALGFDAAGNIRTDKGTVGKDFGHLAHGYVTTSISGQSRTVDRVLIALGAESLGAVNRRQLYVDLSRGREWARVYTDDAAAVARSVKRDEVQVSATELAERRARQRSWRQRIARHVAFLQRRAVQERAYASQAVDRQPHLLPQLKREPERGITYER